MKSLECEKWLKNTLINPRTNRKIKENGPVYKKLEKECYENSNLLKKKKKNGKKNISIPITLTDPKVMSNLLAEGANPNIINEYVEKHGQISLSNDALKCLSLLISAGGDVNQIKNGSTVLDKVYDNAKDFDFFISKGFDTHIKINNHSIADKILQQVIKSFEFYSEDYLGDKITNWHVSEGPNAEGFDDLGPMVENYNKLVRINKISKKHIEEVVDDVLYFDDLSPNHSHFLYSNLGVFEYNDEKYKPKKKNKPKK